MSAEERLHPAEITVIVSSASSLPVGKSGKCRASVIFGVGKTKFRTQPMDSTDPVWNEKSTVPVTEGDSSPLVFTVTRKERPLGEVSIPLEKIRDRSSRPKTEDLGPCRDCAQPVGTLTYECWITKHHSSPLAPSGEFRRSKTMRSRVGTSIRTSFRQSQKSTDSSQLKSPDPRRRAGAGMPSPGAVSGSSAGGGGGGPVSMSLGTDECGNKASHQLNDDQAGSLSMPTTPEADRRNIKRGSSSSSMMPASSAGPNSLVAGADGAEPTRRRFSFARSSGDDKGSLRSAAASAAAAAGSASAKDSPNAPKVTGISPRDGTKQGGTSITIRGSDLGTSAEDVKAVVVCGVPCNLEDLEYVSASKLLCRTPAGKVGTGPVEVETISQGKGSSTVTFSYWDPSVQPEERVQFLEAEGVPQLSTAVAEAISTAASFRKKKSQSKMSVKAASSGADVYEETIRQLTEKIGQLEFENNRLNIYIEKLVMRVMEKNPDLLSC